LEPSRPCWETRQRPAANRWPLASEIATLAGAFVAALPTIEKGGEAAIAAATPFIQQLETLGVAGPNSSEWADVMAAVTANSQTIQNADD